MRLRICDGERERITPATVELVEEAFAPDPLLGPPSSAWLVSTYPDRATPPALYWRPLPSCSASPGTSPQRCALMVFSG
jgi:hypothetical protein